MAQDKNMTNGDYAFFAYSDLVTFGTLRPWTTYNITGENIEHRMKAFSSLKLVI
jgi:hypothetical protein